MTPDRTRREPPPLRLVEVAGTEPVTPHMLRVTFTGPELVGFAVDEPAASVRLLIPPSGRPDLVMPSWNGSEFLLPDGRRPPIRTFTPRHIAPGVGELGLDIVLHDRGTISAWARAAEPGDQAAISGPGRGYTIDVGASSFVLAGDETAIPAISQLLEELPPEREVAVLIEVSRPDAALDLPAHPRASVRWCDLAPDARNGDALVEAVTSAEFDPNARVWVAGEAAAVQRIRRHLFDERGMTRSQATVRGYWKHGRSGDARGG